MSIPKKEKLVKKVHEDYHKKTKIQYKVISDWNFTYRLIIPVLKKYLRRNLKVLDIGCGAGTIDFYLANKVYDIIGVDISEKAVKSCIQTARNLGLRNVKFQKVFFPKERIRGKFDFIIFTEVMEHLEDDRLALKEIHKLLKPNGILLLSTPSINAPLHKLGLTKKFDKEVGHIRRYDSKQLIRLLNFSGFKIVTIYKTEGIIRNFLFVNPIAGKFVRFIKFFISDFVTLLDNLTIPVFGASNWIVVARKVSSK